MPIKFPNGITSFKQNLKNVELNEDAIGWIVDLVLTKDLSVRKLSQDWKISRTKVQRWVNLTKDHIPISTKRGRPDLVDGEGNIELHQFADTNEVEDTTAKHARFADKMKEVIRKTSAKAGKTYVKPIGKRTIRRQMKKLGFKSALTDTSTTKRIEAEHESCSASIRLVVFESIAKHVSSPHLLINYDATQFLVANKAHKKAETVVSVDRSHKNRNKPTKTDPDSKSKELDFAIKWFCIATGGGRTCNDLVFLVADGALEDSEFYVYEVDDLCVNVTGDGRGYVCFSKTRCGNENFFKWLNEVVLFPFIEMTKKKYGLENQYAFLCCDGEAIQINPYLTGDYSDSWELLKVIIAKLAASSTAVSQACDAWKIFSSLKYLEVGFV